MSKYPASVDRLSSKLPPQRTCPGLKLTFDNRTNNCVQVEFALIGSIVRTPAKKVEKWWRNGIIENDCTLNTTVWLRFETDRRDHVLSLKCAVCSQFKDKLTSMCNYRSAFVDGTTNVRTSTFKDHAATDMHTRAMILLKSNMRAMSQSILQLQLLYSVQPWTLPRANKCIGCWVRVSLTG